MNSITGIIIALFVLSAVFFILGSSFCCIFGTEETTAFEYLSGFVIFLTVFALIEIPIELSGMAFHVLVYAETAVFVIILTGCITYLLRQNRKNKKIIFKKPDQVTIILFVLILLQIFYGMNNGSRINGYDTSYYNGHAANALYTDTIYQYNARTGEYIGQEKVKRNLKVYIEAAKERGDSLDHVLFYGPPGLGKTTLAGIIANEMGTHLKVTSGPAIEKPGEMAAILNNLQEGDVLFVDEIHRLNRQVEEVLYPAMEDYEIDIMIGKGATARSIRLELPKFTLVGATTRAGLLSAPLRDRFGVVSHLEFYSVKELETIIIRSASVLNVDIDTKGAHELARRSRGTPRLANRLLKRVRDFAQVKYDGRITGEVADYALNLLDVDKDGLDRNDRLILQTIIGKFGGGPVGIETLAASIGEDSGTLEDVYEPYLIQNGFINRTPRGRVATPAAYANLGVEQIQ